MTAPVTRTLTHQKEVHSKKFLTVFKLLRWPVMMDLTVNYDAGELHTMTIYAAFIAFCKASEIPEKGECVSWLRTKLEANCKIVKGDQHGCQKAVGQGINYFCHATGDKGDQCNNFDPSSLPKTPMPPTTTTTTTTTIPVTDAPFPTGTLVGGFLLGLLFSILAMLLIFCVCKKKPQHDDGLSSAEHGKGKKKSKKNKHGGTTGTSTGASGTTSGTTTGTGKTKKTKKTKTKKAKKAKKAKKNSKATTETHTATAY